MTRPLQSAAIAAAVIAAAHAHAQEGPADFSADLRVVEQGVEDVNPLGVGRVDFMADLAVPIGFGRVYELPPGPDGQPRFARRSGAVWVVFTRSDYVQTRDGTRPVPPPGSTLYIGAPPGLEGAPDAATANPLRVSTLQDLRAASPVDSRLSQVAQQPSDPKAPQPDPQAQPPEATPTMLTSEPYRAARLRTLLQVAAATS